MTATLSQLLNNASKPWKSVLLNPGDTWTVPATATLVTVTGCAAGGIANDCTFSINNPSGQLSFGFVSAINPYWHVFGGAYGCRVAVVNRDGNVPRLLNASIPALSSVIENTLKFKGINYNFLVGYSSSTFCSYGTTDGWMSAQSFGSVGANSSSQLADLIVDPSGLSKYAVFVDQSSYLYFIDVTALSTTYGGTILTNMGAVFGGEVLNGNYVWFGAYSGSKPGFTYCAAAGGITLPGSYTPIVIDAAASSVSVRDMDYSPSLGLYVAVCDSGKIYTSTTLNGTWTSRTSGTTNQLTGVLWANSRFIAVGAAGVILYSSNGITWSAATGAGSTAINRRAIAWNSYGARYGVVDTAGQFYSSADGATWTAGGTANNCQQLSYAGGQFVSFAATATPQWSKDGGVTWNTLSSYSNNANSVNGNTNRSDTVVAKNGAEALRLRGGGNGNRPSYSNKGGAGGSYRYPEIPGSASWSVGGYGPAGIGGSGLNNSYAGSTGIVSGLNSATGKNAGNGAYGSNQPCSGGGGVPLYVDLIQTSAVNLFFPGGSAGSSGGGNWCGAGPGGSLFSPGGQACAGDRDLGRPPGRGLRNPLISAAQ